MSISPEKVLVVAAAQPSRILQLLLLLVLALQSPCLRADEGKAPATQLPNCELLSRGPGVTLQHQEILLHSLLTDLLAELRSDSMSKLASFFHPRAKKTAEIGEKLRILLKNRYTTPWQFSIFRVWRLTVPNALKAIFDNCPESGGASLISQFGYEKQFMVLIQIMGQNELGRLLVSVAPDQGRLYATALRLQQWTQDGEDAESWANKAAAAAKANDSVQAVLAYDVAKKLLSGEDLILYPRQRILQNDRDAIMTQAELLEKINELLKTKTIAYVGSMLSREGSGLLLRETIEKVEPTADLLERCRSRGLALVQQGWIAKASGGIRCNYIFPGMNPLEDSPMGGLYLTHEDLINNQKK